jgi:dihydroflavonol-4-reductase
MAQTMKQAYPDRGIKTREAPDFLIKMMAMFDSDIKTIIPQLGVPLNVSNQRAKDILGIDFIPARNAILASAESIERFNG